MRKILKARFILSWLILLIFVTPQDIRADFDDKYYKRAPYQGWKYIVLHHSATDSGSAEAFHKYHTDMGWGGLCYHFVIGNGKGMPDGEVAEGFRWKQQMAGTHCTVNAWEYNIYGIGICLVGNFEKDSPTPKQLTSLVTLIQRLQKKYKIESRNIVRHRDVPYDNDPHKFEATVCPGKNFPLRRLLRRLLRRVE